MIAIILETRRAVQKCEPLVRKDQIMYVQLGHRTLNGASTLSNREIEHSLQHRFCRGYYIAADGADLRVVNDCRDRQ